MRGIAIVLGGLLAILVAAPLQGCTSGTIGRTRSVDEGPRYKGMTYWEQIDAVERAKGRKPW